jgi:hypothetical protein
MVHDLLFPAMIDERKQGIYTLKSPPGSIQAGTERSEFRHRSPSR